MAIDKFPSRRASNYQRLRRHVAPGDLLLCSGTSPFSRMIQAATQSHWSHVGFLMPLPVIDRVMVLESVESVGVRTVPLSRYLENYNNTRRAYPGGVVVARHDAFPTQDATNYNEVMADFARVAVDMFGYPYDNDAIARIAGRIVANSVLSTLTALFGASPPPLSDMRRDNEYICSEYVAECYASVGITIQTNRAGFIAPADFASAKETQLKAVLKRAK